MSQNIHTPISVKKKKKKYLVKLKIVMAKIKSLSLVYINIWHISDLVILLTHAKQKGQINFLLVFKTTQMLWFKVIRQKYFCTFIESQEKHTWKTFYLLTGQSTKSYKSIRSDFLIICKHWVVKINVSLDTWPSTSQIITQAH